MATTPDHIVVHLSIDTTGFERAIWDAAQCMRRFTINGAPVPPRKPYPRRISRMTARQYRAARRAYARQLAAHRKANR